MPKDSKTLGEVVQIVARCIQDPPGELVRGTVEETLHSMSDAEADALCGAQRYERSPDRVDTRAVSREPSLHAKAGEAKLKAPKLRRQTFETAIIERCQRREAAIEESLIEIVPGGRFAPPDGRYHRALWATEQAERIVQELRHMTLVKAAELVETSIHETLSFYRYP